MWARWQRKGCAGGQKRGSAGDRERLQKKKRKSNVRHRAICADRAEETEGICGKSRERAGEYLEDIRRISWEEPESIRGVFGEYPGKRDQSKKRTPGPGAMPQNWCSQVRRQGLEPWTPWLRVRCSTNWANSAYSNLLSRLNVVLRDASVIICDVFLKCKHFFKISAIFFQHFFSAFFFGPDLPFSRSGSVPPKQWCIKGVLFSAWAVTARKGEEGSGRTCCAVQGPDML